MLWGLSPAASLARCSFWGGRNSVPKHVPFPLQSWLKLSSPCPAPRRPPGVRNLSQLLAIQRNPSGEGEAGGRRGSQGGGEGKNVIFVYWVALPGRECGTERPVLGDRRGGGGRAMTAGLRGLLGIRAVGRGLSWVLPAGGDRRPKGRTSPPIPQFLSVWTPVAACPHQCPPAVSLGHLGVGAWEAWASGCSPGRTHTCFSFFFCLALALFAHPGPLLSAGG